MYLCPDPVPLISMKVQSAVGTSPGRPADGASCRHGNLAVTLILAIFERAGGRIRCTGNRLRISFPASTAPQATAIVADRNPRESARFRMRKAGPAPLPDPRGDDPARASHRAAAIVIASAPAAHT